MIALLMSVDQGLWSSGQNDGFCHFDSDGFCRLSLKTEIGRPNFSAFHKNLIFIFDSRNDFQKFGSRRSVTGRGAEGPELLLLN